MRDYLQHGRRHGVGGSDPIPGLTSRLPFIVANGSVSVTSTPATNHYVDLSLYATSDSALFGIATGSGGLSSINGVTVAEAGVYRAWFTFRFSAGTNADTLIGEPDASSGGVLSPTWFFANTQQDDDTRVIYSTAAQTGTRRVEYGRLIYYGGTFDPTTTFPAPLFVSGRSPAGNNFNLNATVLLEQLSTTYTTNGSVGVVP